MDVLKINYALLKSETPHAWKDLENFYNTNYSAYQGNLGISLEDLPFDFTIGVLLRYFHENGIEWDLVNIDYHALPESIIEIFQHYEKTMGHFS